MRPHHVPKEWADKYKGKFDDGWDAYREKVFARQKELGIVAEDAVLSRHDPDVQQWDDLSDDERRLYARMMEVFAGFFEHTDHQIGRLLDFLESDRPARQHADHGHLRQRRQRRRRAARLGQREQVLQQRARRPAAEPRRARRTRRPEVLQPLPVGLDVRRQHAVPAVEARDLPRRRVGPVPRALARGHQGQGRDPHSVRARHRHGAHGAGVAGHRSADRIARRRAIPDRGSQLRAHLRRRRRADQASHPVLRDVRPPRRSITTVGARYVLSPGHRSPRPA